MLSGFPYLASQLLELDFPARTLTFAPTAAQPVLVPDAAKDRGILTYIVILTQN